MNEKFHPATVRHVTKDHVVIAPGKGYTVTIFSVAPGGAVEALVTAIDGSETIRLLVAAPSDGQRMQIKKDDITGVVNIVYTTEGKENV